MTLRYFAQHVNRDGLAGLQLLGRLAAMAGITDQQWPFALLPGSKPAAPTWSLTEPIPETEEAPRAC